MEFIQKGFGWVLEQLYHLTSNYGIAIIMFSLVVKLVLLYPSARGKKSMMKMSRLAPQVQALQNRYKDDQQKASMAVSQLYKEEGVSMFGGCLWSLLPMLILFPLFYVIREPLVYLLGLTANQAGKVVSWLLEQGQNLGSNSYYHQLAAAPLVGDFASEIAAAVEGVDASALYHMNFNFFGINLGQIPNWQFWTWDSYNWSNIGLFLLAFGSAASQVLSMLISNKMNSSVSTDKNGVQDKEAAKQANSTGKTMMYVMPIMSLWIGFTVPAALSLYWAASGLLGILQDVLLTLHYRKVYDAEDAERLARFKARMEEQERLEAKWAERRAANPDGITANTSKRKLEKKQKAQNEAAARAAAEAYAKKKGLTLEQAEKELGKQTKSGIPDRPNAKGRNYDPNRYASKNKEE